jgi:hypothetical protein
MKSILSNILFAIIMVVVALLCNISYHKLIFHFLIGSIYWWDSVIMSAIGTMSVGLVMGVVGFYFIFPQFIFQRFSKNLFTKVFSIIISIFNAGVSIVFMWTQYNVFSFMNTLEFILISTLIIIINYGLSFSGSNKDNLFSHF